MPTESSSLARTPGGGRASPARPDGKAKYRLAALKRTGLVDAEGLGRALDHERARERRLREAGVIVVRWEARDVLDPVRARRLAAQRRRELTAARAAHSFSGRVVQL